MKEEYRLTDNIKVVDDERGNLRCVELEEDAFNPRLHSDGAEITDDELVLDVNGVSASHRTIENYEVDEFRSDLAALPTWDRTQYFRWDSDKEEEQGLFHVGSGDRVD